MDESLQTRIRDNLVAGRTGQFQFVSDLVKTPSQNPSGETTAVTELTVKALKGLGLGVERHPVTPGSDGEASETARRRRLTPMRVNPTNSWCWTT